MSIYVTRDRPGDAHPYCESECSAASSVFIIMQFSYPMQESTLASLCPGHAVELAKDLASQGATSDLEALKRSE